MAGALICLIVAAAFWLLGSTVVITFCRAGRSDDD